MKLKYDFMVREIVDDYVLIPMGDSALEFSGFLTTNAVGATIMEELKNDITEENLLLKILEEFDVDETTAKSDVEEFLNMLRTNNLIE